MDSKSAKINQVNIMASKLIITLDGEVVKEYVINKEAITIGRKRENDIQLNDLTVSGRHALITVQNDTPIVEDLGSTNGTLLNGSHINKATLQHGNVVQIGHHLFTYMNDEKEKYEPTMSVRAEHDNTQIVLPEWDMGSKAVKVRGQPLGALRKKDDPIGTNGIEMNKRYSSLGYQGRRLAQITRESNGYSIIGVSNGNNRRATDVPLINGDKLDSTMPRKLKEQDIISIAGVEMEFYYIH
jgi:pSer/pThr/pTyr-binding forkhead associated (FHA) protein